MRMSNTSTSTLTVGDDAPLFELMNEKRETVKLSDLRGKTVVLLFYPMDFSSVCTSEHCAFGPQLYKIAPDDQTVVFGVNCDHPFSHAAYRKQFDIAYPLLSDPTRKMVKAYAMFAGEEPFNCAKRGTVVIDPKGKIATYAPAEISQERTVENLARYASAARALS